MKRRSPWALALLFLGCSPSPSVPARLDTSGDEAAARPIPAFVVAMGEETYVIPVDPREPVRSAGGLWVLDDGDGRVLRPTPDPESLGRPICYGSGTPRACALPDRVILEPGTLEPTLDPECACFEPADEETGGMVSCDGDPFADLGLSEWSSRSGVSLADLSRHRGSDEDEGYAEEEADDLDVNDEPCAESGSHPVSLVGGVLYHVGFEHNACDGFNLYDSIALGDPLTSDALPIDEALNEELSWSCSPEGAFLDDWGSPEEIATGCARHGAAWHPIDAPEDGDGGDAEECYGCDRGAYIDGVIPFLRRGRVILAAADVQVMGGGPRWTSSRPMSAETCPSPSDPCGSPETFAGLLAMIAASPEIDRFVASDASAALALLDGEARIFVPGAGGPVRDEPLIGELLGVRFHADASRLLAAIDAELARVPPIAECPPGQSLVGEECVTRCAEDADCRATSACDVVCEAGVCVDREVECAPGHPCAAGARCEAYRCTTIPLAGADTDFEDRRGGSEWGNRCIAHLRSGDLDAAEAACAAGLDVVERDSTRGALLYNLGLIAQRRGDLQLARLYFQASLVVRPNETVERALTDAGGPLWL